MRAQLTVAEQRRGFRPLLVLTAWLVGLFIAVMTGMLSAYLVLSVLYTGSQVVSKLRRRDRREVRQVDSGPTIGRH